jgi:hypothetical protein
MDGCIHLSRRDVAYTFSDKIGRICIWEVSDYSRASSARLIIAMCDSTSIINAVQQLLAQAHSQYVHSTDKSVYHYSSPSASAPSQRRRPDYVYSECADCLWQRHCQWEEINNNVTLSIVLPSNCTSHTTSLREQRKLAIAREEVVVVIQWIILVAVICLVLEINLIKNLILKVALSLLIQHI